MNLFDLAQRLDLVLKGKSVDFQGAALDSRHIQPHQLFIATKGEHVDGHDYLAEARAKGASAALVSHPVDDPLPQLIASDVRLALGEIASLYRETLTMPVIALTGSCGKTSTKSLIASILAQVGQVHATTGTLNNDYGMPLTLLNAKPTDDFVVLEMGANHLYEIAYLTYIARPTIALITNAGPVHLEGFGSIEGVAKGKGEIFQGLSDNGLAVLNLDDPYNQYWQQCVVGHPFLSFGFNAGADIRATDIQQSQEGGIDFLLDTLSGQTPIHLSLMGEHNVKNALAAAATAIGLGISLEAIAKGLSMAVPVDKRLMTYKSKSGACIIDDSYNANPLSMEMAMRVLLNHSDNPVLVAGDMAELGEEANTYHRLMGEKAKILGIKKLYTVGSLSANMAKGFGEGAHHYADQSTLIEALQKELNPEVTILIKGSRSAKMENVVKALLLT